MAITRANSRAWAAVGFILGYMAFAPVNMGEVAACPAPPASCDVTCHSIVSITVPCGLGGHALAIVIGLFAAVLFDRLAAALGRRRNKELTHVE